MRLAAAVRSAGSNDPADYPRLVELLDDGDIEARMLAIEVLERRTGTTRGFDYAAPPEQRAGPLKEWRAWAEQFAREASPSSATTQQASNQQASKQEPTR